MRQAGTLWLLLFLRQKEIFKCALRSANKEVGKIPERYEGKKS